MRPQRIDLAPDGEAYPPQLRDAFERPPVLHVVGDPACLSMPCISVIGARRATPYGLDLAGMAGRIGAECGITVVSGGALGCDHAASRAALDAGGRTVIVAGCGADVVYPESSRDIFRAAPEHGGAIVSLEGWGAPPRRYAFPRRNRIIAALSRSTIVTEAGRKSGTMTTADAAMQLGRNVYAIPGSIYSPTSQGTNYLICNGAAAIPDETSLEVQISLDYGAGRLVAQVPTPDRGRVLSALVASPSRPADLAAKIGVDLLTITRTLTSYEAAGLAQRLPDGSYTATQRAFHMTSDRRNRT